MANKSDPYGSYDHNKHDSLETRERKADAARRGKFGKIGAAKAERARIAQRIEEIGRRNDEQASVSKRDAVFYLSTLRTGGFLKCRKVG